MIKEFVEGPGYVHVSPRTVELARQLLPRLFALCRTDDGKSDTLALPPKNFPPQQLIDAAQRCLTGVQLSGGNAVKSIEF